MTSQQRPRVMPITDGESARVRHAALAGSPLDDGSIEIVPVSWQREMDDPERAERFDAALPDANAMVAGPWMRRFPPFTPERWERANRLNVIAGTFANRFEGCLDVGDALSRRHRDRHLAQHDPDRRRVRPGDDAEASPRYPRVGATCP